MVFSMLCIFLSRLGCESYSKSQYWHVKTTSSGWEGLAPTSWQLVMISLEVVSVVLLRNQHGPSEGGCSLLRQLFRYRWVV